MRAYFGIQVSMLNRIIKGWGISPFIGYPLFVAFFLGGSWWLFYKSEQAAYFYVLLALFLPGKFAAIKRNEFLRICFGNTRYRIIRIVENMIAVLPFVIFLFFKQFFLLGLFLLSIAVVLSFFRPKPIFGKTIPTPFPKYLFEFIAGFRKTFLIVGLCYLLAGIGIAAENFNLGILALVLLFILMSSYYSEIEKEYFVWQYHFDGSHFLWEKIKTGLFGATMLASPVVLAMGIAFRHQLLWLLLFLSGGYVFLACIISMKYTCFPDSFGILQVIMLAAVFFFPPLLIVVIPYFVYQSIKRLNVLLK